MKNIELTYELMEVIESVFSSINKAHGIVDCVKNISVYADTETLQSLNIPHYEKQLFELSNSLREIVEVEADAKNIDYILPYSIEKTLGALYKSMTRYLEGSGPDQYDKKTRQSEVMALFGASEFVCEAHTTLSQFTETFYPPAQVA